MQYFMFFVFYTFMRSNFIILKIFVDLLFGYDNSMSLVVIISFKM